MTPESSHYIGEAIQVVFSEPPMRQKTPPCPDGFWWRGQLFRVTEMLAEWRSFSRRGKSARNMQPAHAEAASGKGSWGVGRFFFRVRVETGQVFEIYYDRAPRDVDDRYGRWCLFLERTPDAE